MSQNEKHFAAIWQCVCALSLQGHPSLQGKSKGAIVRWFARETLDALQEPNTATSTAAPVAEADADGTSLLDIQDVVNPGAVAALTSTLQVASSSSVDESPIDTLAAAGALACVEMFLEREQQQLNPLQLTARTHSDQQVVDGALARGILSDDVVGSACNIRGAMPKGG